MSGFSMDELHAAWSRGMPLKGAEVEQLIQEVELRPSDLMKRAELLGAFFLVFIDRPWLGPDHQQTDRLQARAIDEVGWWLENWPQRFTTFFLPRGFAEHCSPDAMRALVESLEPAAERNVCSALLLAELLAPQGRTHQLKVLMRAHAQFPEEPDPALQIAQLFGAHPQGEADDDPDEAIRWYGIALERTSTLAERGMLLTDACEAALAAGRVEQAEEWALELLSASRVEPPNWNTGNAHYLAHETLGHIALLRGDAERAGAQLIDASRSSGSPQLNSFGPTFELAAELLALGKRAVVLEFLRGVREFWASGEEQVDLWISELERGEDPDLRRFPPYRKPGI